MKKSTASLLFCGAVSLGLSHAGVSLRAQPFPVSYAAARSPYEASVDLARPERERIRAHLARVEADLRAHPPAGLSDAQRAARDARLDDLHAYWTRGEFPLNRDFPGRLIPYFIDADGVPCAMGYLVIASGRAAFAEEIRKNRNNAYIPEISAADGRLAAWLEANGMTLDEAARVQPSYGPPDLYAVRRLATDTLGRLWAWGPDRNTVGGEALFRRDTVQWRYQEASGYADYCVAPSGALAKLDHSGGFVRWKGKSYAVPPVTGPMMSCAWDVPEKSLWLGTASGLRRYARTGTLDTLAATAFSTRVASDTVLSVAVTDSFAWAGTTRGIVRRAFLGDTTPVAWDSATLGGKRVTALRKGGSRTVWGGLEGNASGWAPVFSTRGLLHYDGATWRRYRAMMSSVHLPGDTIHAFAVRDTGSVWIATRTGFYRFSGTASTPKVADIPSGAIVYDLVGDAEGFYAGTSLGVYRFANNALSFIGLPTGLRPGLAGKGPAPPRGLRLMTRAEAARALETDRLRSVLGRRAPSGAAQGVYLPDGEVTR